MDALMIRELMRAALCRGRTSPNRNVQARWGGAWWECVVVAAEPGSVVVRLLPVRT